MQWHPLLGELIRLMSQAFCELEPSQAVGEVPRQADFVLTRRKSVRSNPFHGIWRFLSTCNILEYMSGSTSN